MSEFRRAIEFSEIEKVREMLSRDPALATRAYTNLTPLGHAVDVLADSLVQDSAELSTEVVELLLAAGADPDARVGSGSSAREYALTSEHSGLRVIFGP